MPSSYHTRICANPECNDTKRVAYKPKGTELCQKCAGKKHAKRMHKTNRKEEHEKKVYWYFCPECPSVRKLSSKRKSALCGECNRRKIGKSNAKDDKVKPRVRHFKVCIECGFSRQVTKKQYAGFITCRKCRNIADDVMEKVSQESTPAVPIKENVSSTDDNYIGSNPFKVDVITPEERKMIDDYLANFGPSTKCKEGPIPHVTPSSGIVTTSVLG